MASSDPDMLDAIVVGAGPAGLSAAIYLARFKRAFRVVHDDQSRAGWIPLSHNHPGFPDGVSGVDLMAAMAAQARRYGAVIGPGVVSGLTATGDGFSMRIDGELHTARTVLLATGVLDRAPDLLGVAEAVRNGLVRICPICDGFEVQGQALAVIGDDAQGAREAAFLTTYSDRITLIHVGEPGALGDEERRGLDEAGIEVVEAPIQSVNLDNDRIAALCFTDGGPRVFDAIYSALGTRPRSELAVEAGARIADDGSLIVDDHQETTIRGLFAAGDLVRGLNQISTAQGEAAIAATAIHNRLRGTS